MNLGQVNDGGSKELMKRVDEDRVRERSDWHLNVKRTMTVDVEELFKTKTKNKAISSLTVKMIAKLTGNFFQSLLSIFSCVVYVVSTYVKDQSDLMSTIEYVVAGLFSVDYLWGFTIAKDKRAFMLHPMNLVDLVTIFPVLLNLFTVRCK